MYRAATLALPGLNAVVEYKFEEFPEKHVCEGIIVQVTGNDTVAGGDIIRSTTLLRDFLNHYLANMTLSYGPASEYMPYPGVLGSELRNAYRALFEDEIFSTVVAGGQLHTGANIADGALGASVYAYIPFAVPNRGDNQRLPGTSQMRTMKLRIRESGTALIHTDTDADTVTRAAGNAQIDLFPVTKIGPDDWCPVVSLDVRNESKLDVLGPDGLILAAWEQTTTLAATAILQYDAKIGDKDVHNAVAPLVTNIPRLQSFDTGGSNYSDEVCPLYHAPADFTLDELPHGPLYIKTPIQYVTPIQLRTVYIPSLDELEASKAIQVAARRVGAVLATTKDASKRDVHPGSHSTRGIRFFTPSKSEFFTRPGLVAEGSKVAVSVPDSVQKSVESAASAGGSGTVGQAIARMAQKQVTQKIPGSQKSNGVGFGGFRNTVRATFGHLFK